MKFIINGHTFDTGSCRKVAVSRGVTPPAYEDLAHAPDVRWEDILYRTRKGAFFLHERATERPVKGGHAVVSDQAKELSPQDALKWIVDNDAAILDGSGLDLRTYTPGGD